MPARFVDTTVLLRYFTGDDEEKALQALALLLRVERGEERVETSPIVIFEVILILDRTYNVPRERIHALVKPVLEMRGLTVPGKPLLLESLDRFADSSRKLSFADFSIAIDAQSRGITEIHSWDRGFDRIEGITRIEPSESGS